MRTHPPLVPLRVRAQSALNQKMQNCIEILGRANKALPKYCYGSSMDAAAAAFRWFILLPSPLLHSEHAARFGSPLLSGHCEDIHYYAERAERLCCLSHCCWPFFFPPSFFFAFLKGAGPASWVFFLPFVSAPRIRLAGQKEGKKG